MPELDSTAKAAVESHGFAPASFIWLDIDGDPISVTTFGQDVAFSGTGDSDLDGNTFVAFGGQLINVGEIGNSDSGSDTLSVTLSGIVKNGIDSDLMNDIGDKSLWQGRQCRVWTQIYDPTGETKRGAIVPLYTGYMSKVGVKSAPESQAINLSVENYLSFHSQASNRSYLNQGDYDAADTSAQATIAAANGMRRNTGAAPVSGPGGPGTGSTGTIGDWGFGDRFSYGADWPGGA